MLATLALFTAFILQLPVGLAAADESQPSGSSAPRPRSDPTSTLATVTVEARRNREIKQQVQKYVSGGVLMAVGDSLKRWDSPVCPLVAGLESKPAELIRTRVLEVARQSHAPVGSAHCAANLFIVITDSPELLLEKWNKRARGLFSTCNGLGAAKRFLRSRQAVKVYYNDRSTSGRGAGIGVLELAGVRTPPAGGCFATGSVDTTLHHGTVPELTSVIIVVDSTKAGDITMGALADYIAMVGLAPIRPQPVTGAAPSILNLFTASDSPPQQLTQWDAAFLDSLYTTDQASVLEVVEIEDRMLKEIVGSQPRS